MHSLITCPQCLRSFCNAHDQLYPEVVIETTLHRLGLTNSNLSIIDMTEAIIGHVETTPAFEDNIADAKLRLREMIEGAYFKLYPKQKSVMGIKLPLTP